MATKYLSSYFTWFRWLEYFKTEKDVIKVKHLLVQSHTSHITTKVNEFTFNSFNTLNNVVFQRSFVIIL